MIQKIEKWDKGSELPEVLFVESFVDDYNGVRVILKGESANDPCFELLFEDCLSYRNSDESDRIKTINNSQELSSKGTFYILRESEYLNWFAEERQRKEPLIHFIIGTPNDFLEIITIQEPIVTKL